MRFLFNLIPASGHFPANLAVARELVGAGHSVAFLCLQDHAFAETRLRQAGLDVQLLSPPIAGSGKRPDSVETLGRRAYTQLLRDPSFRTPFLHGAFVSSAAAFVPAIRQAIQSYGPDVFCNESVSLAGAIAAELERVPWVGICSSWVMMAPPEFTCRTCEDFAALDGARKALASSMGVSLAFHWGTALSPLLNVVFGAEELTPIHASLPPATSLMGPVRQKTRDEKEIAFPWHRLQADRPLVYISAGSLFAFEPAVMKDLVEIAHEQGANVVVVSNDPSEAAYDDGERIICVPFAPQLALLERAALFVTHAGANSTLEGLLAGVPLLLLPIEFDQPLNAMFAERAGFGRALDPWAWDRGRCADAIEAMLLPDSPERARAKEFQAAMRGRDGGAQAAEVLPSLVQYI